ncbi:hypothetical protein F5B18DRAFT_622068 [Nemania serpens]|nr:hypothetical protein F5B18DRAFT_622068 [Nemania serpens]
MYITKIFLPAMLALSGLSQARLASDESAIEAQATEPSLLTAPEGTVFALEQDTNAAGTDNSINIDAMSASAEELGARDEAESADEEQRRRCRRREYWDESRRRCRRCRRFSRDRCYRY